MVSLHDVRRDYSGHPLPEDPGAVEPWPFFGHWVQSAVSAGEVEPTAMTLATVDQAGRPASRIVLLKEYSPRGLVFYTGYDSAKGHALTARPVAAVSLWWPLQMRQVRAVGAVTRLPRAESEAYFAKRPRASQIEAWASQQSQPLLSRGQLIGAVEEARGRFEGAEVPCPPSWGGFVIDVDSFEFWQGQPGRLHDRIVCLRGEDGAWRCQRLQP